MYLPIATVVSICHFYCCHWTIILKNCCFPVPIHSRHYRTIIFQRFLFLLGAVGLGIHRDRYVGDSTPTAPRWTDSHGNLGMTVKGNEKYPYEICTDYLVVKIASGADHIVLLTNKGDILSCGCPEQGQLGRTTERGSSRNARGGFGKLQIAKLLQPLPITLKPTLRLHFDNVWTGTYGTFAKVANSDDIYVFGLNNYGQLGLSSLSPQFTPKLSKEFSKYKWEMITSAQHHTIALDKDGKTYAIGRKEYGRLGLGQDSDDATVLTLIPFLQDKKVINIACGSSTSFAVTENGDLYGWGMGTVGQLGTGREDDCYEPTLIKNKSLLDRRVLRVSSGGQHTVILAALINRENHNGVAKE